MRFEHRTYERGGSKGEVDTQDLILGFVAVLVLPLACYLLAGFFGPTTTKDPYAVRNNARVKVGMDAEEVEAQWQAAEEFYSVNAKTLMKQAFDQQDAILKEHLRRWTSQTLKSSKAKLKDLDTMIAEDKSAAQFLSYRTRIEALEKQVDGDIAKVKSLDILGQDDR